MKINDKRKDGEFFTGSIVEVETKLCMIVWNLEWGYGLVDISNGINMKK